ncbi:hypothetical protein BH20ACT9_BH20ACT9_09500 [soil metagenome]
MRSAGLLLRFAALTFAACLLVGLGLSAVLADLIRERGLVSARRATEVIAEIGIQPRLTPRHLEHGLPPRSARALRRTVAASSGEGRILRLFVYNDRREIVYADDPRLQGHRVPEGEDGSDELSEALEGHVEAEILDAQAIGAGEAGRLKQDLVARYGSVLEVYAPLRLGGREEPAGVLELYQPYAPIAAHITRDTRSVQLALAAGLALLWAVSFPIVAGASRRLRRQGGELREHAERNEFLAYHDALTGLPNRLLLADRVQQAVAAARRTGTSVGVLVLDLDWFKEINDTLGHQTGDALLGMVGPRLQGELRDMDTVARLGGDEFAVLLPRVDGVGGAREVAERLLAALHLAFPVGDLLLAVEASVGVAVYPDLSTAGAELLQQADVALYAAKEARGAVALYQSEHDHTSVERLTLLGDLRQAIDADELVLHYQPQADLRQRVITGVEALVRWRHPQRGMLAPDQFIPAAEQSGLMKPLTLTVVDKALRQLRRWRGEGHRWTVAVNISARNLLDPELPDDVAGLLAKHRLEPGCLELEITESTVMVDPGRALDVLSRLSGLGVGLAIDDYGTGYSSLAYLRRLPVDTLKIDKSFVTTMATDDGNASIVRSTVELARSLGLRVVAEGVEDATVWRALTELGCDSAQGYFLGHPRAAGDLDPDHLSLPAAPVRPTGPRTS